MYIAYTVCHLSTDACEPKQITVEAMYMIYTHLYWSNTIFIIPPT